MPETQWPRGAPGSQEAVEAGCICAVWDNHYGRGYWGDGTKYGWDVRGDCPVHGKQEEGSDAAQGD